MRHFLQLFVEKYGDTFPDIEFENRPTPRHCSRLSTSKSKYDHTYYCWMHVIFFFRFILYDAIF